MAPEMEATLQGVQMGLTAAAVSIAIKAALDLSAKLASEPLTRWLNALAAAANLLAPDIPWVLPLSLFVAGCLHASQGRFKAFWARVGLLADQEGPPKAPSAAVRDQPVTYFLAMLCLISWIALFAGLVFWQGLGPPWWADLFERFYRAGSLVWGGGPVVLPLLLPEVVPRFVSEVQFLQGFAFAQAMPGPMFNFAAYLGGVYQGPLGAIIAWFGLFLPGLLLIYAALPFWALATTHPGTQSFLKGVNAAASGLVIAAAFTLFDVVRTPPQRAITLLTFIIHNYFGPKNFGPKYNPPATIAIGALLGLPLCVPYVLTHPRP
jgi:chromate transporter